MMLWSYVIPWGDTAFTGVLALCIAGVLGLGGYRALAVRWLVAYTAASALIFFGKLAFDFGGWYAPSLAFYSISGHAMQTTAVYPLLFMMVGAASGASDASSARWGLRLGIAASAFMGLALVADDYHTLSEVIAGTAVGAAVVFSYARSRLSLRPVHLSVLIALPLLMAWFVDTHAWVDPAKATLWQRAAIWAGATQRFVRRIGTDPTDGRQRVWVRRLQTMPH